MITTNKVQIKLEKLSKIWQNLQMDFKKELIKFFTMRRNNLQPSDFYSFLEKNKRNFTTWATKEIKKNIKRKQKVKKILKNVPDNTPDQISALAKHLGDTYFITRKKLNAEFIEYVNMRDSDIPEIKDFWNYIESLQVKYNIPELKPEDDFKYYISYYNGDELENYESKWLEDQGKEKKESFEKEIEELIERYDLSIVFFNWFWWLTMYDQVPSWKPSYNWSLINDRRDIRKILLTTGEKNYLRNFATNNINGDKRRPTKEIEPKSKKINKLLKMSGKENRKPFLTINTAIKTLKKKTFEDDPELGRITNKNTYKDLAAQNFDDEQNDEANAGKLRQQNVRVRKRIVKIMKIKKLKT
jgi:hypothetical protein